ncbi:MAG: anti-sigma factor family protein [Mangrovibacterium sp.]
MSHKSIHKDLIFYLDNELPEQRKVTIEKHLEECTDCQRFSGFF